MRRIRKASIDDSDGLAVVQVDSYRRSYAGFLPHDYLAQFTYEDQEQDWRDWIVAHPASRETGFGQVLASNLAPSASAVLYSA